jgi:hypothetical protein
MTMSDALDYDKLVLDQLRHIEDVNVKFALQNYAAAGAVFLAYFTAKLPLRITVLVVVGLALVFTGAICFNVARYKLFWKLHRIARDHWFAAGQSKLRGELGADPKCEEYLTTKTLSNWAFAPTVIINLLPAVAAGLLLWVMRK